MKKTISIIGLFLSFYASSQNQTLVIKAIDAKGQTDSIIIGYRANATVGIDQNLAEVDYFGKPYSEIDIRSIQRNEVLQAPFWLKCDSYNYILPFEQNIDLKVDYREHLICGNHFIIQVHALNYPVTFKIGNFVFDQNQVIPFNSYLSNGDCGSLKSVSGDFISNFSSIVFNNSTENQLIGLHPQLIICYDGIKEINSNTQLTVYPNPAKNILTIKSSIPDIKIISIYNCLGNEIDKINIHEGENKLDISTYTQGIYLIRVDSEVIKFSKQ
ncbi:MAG: T9SS type A sorting domain-containing protein [Paludibacter sp.]